MAVIIVITVASGNNYAKEQQFRKLMALRQNISSSIKRDGRDMQVPAASLLVGDIIYISQGDQIPADCILIQNTKMLADMSALTGESKAFNKESLPSVDSIDIVDPFLKAGAMIAEGTGLAVVCGVGPNTDMGKLQKSISEEDRELSPLQKKLERIAECN